VMVFSACIQKTHDEEPIWLEGQVSISRSPVAHMGDGRPIAILYIDMSIDSLNFCRQFSVFVPSVNHLQACVVYLAI
jgi:hypothetical protein